MLTINERALAIPKVLLQGLDKCRQGGVTLIQLLQGEVLPVSVGSSYMDVDPTM